MCVDSYLWACHIGCVSSIGKPVVIPKLDSKLGSKIVKALIDDNKRAAKERERRKSDKDDKTSKQQASEK